MDMNKREIEERGGEILGKMNVLSELIEKKRQTKEDKIEMRKEFNGLEKRFGRLLFDLTTE
ncbi:MAG: hypothetical protein MASP_01905 [Candidatus Methanolliviera sp. GoM_asphalt]|nr:MAG: hypothetical protein MASP_01905 [Candidatus Methanolliviera sp. GoM_asphalt]